MSRDRRPSSVLAALLALALFPCKTALAGEEGGTTVDASKGGFTLKSGDNSVTFGARVQLRATLDDREAFDADTAGTGDGVEDGTATSFDIPRLRLTFKGGMFRPWLKYELQFEMSRTGGEASSKIKDAVIEIVGSPLATLKLGQFKVPFSLQELTSSGRLQFVDRAITNAKFAPARDTGLALAGTTSNKRFGYTVGAFNGSGESRQQDDEALLWAARVWFDPLGEYKLSESAADGPDRAILHVGFGYRTGEAIRGTATAGIFEDPDDQSAGNVELAFAWKRLFATGEVFVMSDELQNPATAADVDSEGFHAQVGFMAIPKRLELGLRHAAIDPHDDIGDDEVTETRAVAGYYWKGHNLKLQGDAGWVEFEQGFATLPDIAKRGMPSLGSRLGPPQEYRDKQIRLQLQLAF